MNSQARVTFVQPLPAPPSTLFSIVRSWEKDPEKEDPEEEDRLKDKRESEGRLQ